MKEILEALEARGYVHEVEVNPEDNDYPLEFFVRESDKATVICDVEEAARGIIVRLRPHDKWKEWYIEDFDMIPDFLDEFDATFEEFAKYIKDVWTW